MGLKRELERKDQGTMTGTDTKGVDTHAHIFTQDLNLIRAGEGYVPDYDAPLGTYLAKLKTHGLTHSVLIQPSFLGADNGFLLHAIEQHRNQLRCMIIADPSTPPERLDRMKEQGAAGIRFIFYGTSSPDFTAKRWGRFLDRISNLDWIVELYCPASLLPRTTKPLLDRGCRLLIDHYGRPDPRLGLKDPGFEFLLGLSETGRVWVDISGPYRNGEGGLGEEVSTTYLHSLRQSFGLERILWGSDWPCVRFEPWNSFESSWTFLNRVLPKTRDRETVLWKTPADLFGFN